MNSNSINDRIEHEKNEGMDLCVGNYSTFPSLNYGVKQLRLKLNYTIIFSIKAVMNSSSLKSLKINSSPFQNSRPNS